MKPAAALALGCLLLAPVWAVTESANFSVTVNLLPASNATCTSQSLSEQANAIVQVVCGTGQFVAISPNPAKPFLGTHGSAFRYHFGSYTEVAARASLGAIPAAYTGGGTVTALSMTNRTPSDAGGASTSNGSPVEIVVSF